MKILMVTFGGSTTEVHYLYGLLSKMKNSEVVIAIPSYVKKEDVIKLEQCSSVKKIIYLKIPRDLKLLLIKYINPFYYICLIDKLKGSYDIIHFVFELRLPILLIKKIVTEKPVIITVHEPRSTIHTLIRKLILNSLQKYNCKLLCKVATKVIVHGEKHKELLAAEGINKNKIEIIPHGQFSFWNKNAKKIEEEENHILFFGKITPYKGISYLIEGAKILHKRIPSLKVTIAGAGDFSKYLPLILKCEYFNIINRYIPDEEVERLFSRASLVIMPYTEGSQSGIISIAANFKKPVVATDVGNFSDMIVNEKTGILVPPRDAQALTNAIEKLLVNDKLRHDMGENAYKFMNENFSWEKISEQTSHIYNNAIVEWKAQKKEKGLIQK